MSGLLPIAGYVLAGGRSSRMGADKATLRLGGRTLVEIALEKLRAVCAEVAIAGSREDLQSLARVVPDLRPDCGPAAAIEAGLRACGQPWAMFVPIDVPLTPARLLRTWAERTVPGSGAADSSRATGVRVSYLRAEGAGQPAFVLVAREMAAEIGRALDRDERRLTGLWESVETAHGPGAVMAVDAEALAAEWGAEPAMVADWFLNANTPEDWERLLERHEALGTAPR